VARREKLAAHTINQLHSLHEGALDRTTCGEQNLCGCWPPAAGMMVCG
jgi:hypothetical protein